MWSQAAAQTKNDPMVPSGKLNHGHCHSPLLLPGHGPRHDLSSSTADVTVTMASGGEAGYSHQAVPLLPPVSSPISLHNAQTVLLLFLSRLSIAYLHSIVAPAAGGPRSWTLDDLHVSLPHGMVMVARGLVVIYNLPV